MSNVRFISSVCKVIEHLTKAEITKQGYKLVLNYLDEYSSQSLAACGRKAITKYTAKDIPTLEEIKINHSRGKFDELDKLVLKMEYEANKLGTLKRQ